MNLRRVMVLSLVGVAVLFLLCMLYVSGPHAGWLPECGFYRITGLACPGCGMTRATHAALHGRWAEAFRFNPMGFVVLPVILCGIGMEALHWARGRPTGGTFWRSRFLLTLLAVLLVFSVLRNVPLWPFSLLALP